MRYLIKKAELSGKARQLVNHKAEGILWGEGENIRNLTERRIRLQRAWGKGPEGNVESRNICYKRRSCELERTEKK